MEKHGESFIKYNERVLIFSQNIWSVAPKLLGLRAFWPVVMAAVAVVIAPLYAAIIIATRHVVATISPGSSLYGLTVARLAARSMKDRRRIRASEDHLGDRVNIRELCRHVLGSNTCCSIRLGCGDWA